MDAPVALITGAARRIGRATAERLHVAGWRVIVHANNRFDEAQQYVDAMNIQRPDSAAMLRADLRSPQAVSALAMEALATYDGRIDALVNNASLFVADEGVVDSAVLYQVNALAPVELTMALRSALTTAGGAVVNITDIYADRPKEGYLYYSMTKAALANATLSLAQLLAPDVRVNAVAPGAIAWLNQPLSEQAAILARTPLGRTGCLDDIAAAVYYLLCDGRYVNGHTIIVDGGRSALP